MYGIVTLGMFQMQAVQDYKKQQIIALSDHKYIIYIYIYIYIYIKTSFIFLPISAENRLCRPVGAVNAYTPARGGFADDAYTSANETADGTTWRRTCVAHRTY